MSYLETYLKGKNLNKLVARSVELLKDLNFTHIAVRGNSGLLMGAPLAVALDKELIIVRKNTESSHSSSLVEGWGKKQKILIVDDFVESGDTMDSINEAIQSCCDTPEIVGVLLYGDTRPEKFTVDINGKKYKRFSISRYESLE